MTKLYRYTAYGFTFSSELEIPGATTLGGRDEHVDVRIRWQRDSDPLAGAPELAEGQGDGVRLLREFPGLAKFTIRGGREVLVEPLGEVTESEIVPYLVATAFGTLLQQRGLFPLHACAVRMGEGCVAVAGDSGVGKSTLASWLERLGYPIVCDDLCALEADDEGVVMWPGFPRVKLWDDAIRLLGIEPKEGRRIWAGGGREKFELDLADRAGDGRLPLAAIYVLDGTQIEAVGEFQELSGHARVLALVTKTYRVDDLAPQGLQEWHFQRCLEIARGVRVFRWARARDMGPHDTALRLVRHVDHSGVLEADRANAGRRHLAGSAVTGGESAEIDGSLDKTTELPISVQDVVRRSSDPLFACLEDSVVLLSIEQGRYFGFNEVASRLWELLEEPSRVEDLRDTIVSEFEVERDDCEADVLKFLTTTRADGLIEVCQAR